MGGFAAGERWVQLAKAYGIESVVVEAPYGHAVPISEMKKHLGTGGPFRAVFDGFVRVPLLGEFTFRLRGRGEAVLRINGKEVLRGSGELAMA